MSNPRSKPAPSLPRPQSRPILKNPQKTATATANPSSTTKTPPPTRSKPSTLQPTPPTTPTAPVPNWLNRRVQSSVAGVGAYAAGFVTSIGTGVNRVGEGVGRSIAETTRGWGQGVAGYGNEIKDSVGVGGPRRTTAGNPLGLAGQGESNRTPSTATLGKKGNGCRRTLPPSPAPTRMSQKGGTTAAGSRASGTNPLGL